MHPWKRMPYERNSCTPKPCPVAAVRRCSSVAMSRALAICVLVVLFGAKGYAQQGLFEYGVSVKPTLTFTQELEQPSTISMSPGVFMHYNLTRRIGLGLSAEYLSQRIHSTNYELCEPIDIFWGFRTLCPVPALHTYSIIQIPVWLSVNLDYSPDSKWKTYAVGGYSLGNVLSPGANEVDYQLDRLVQRMHFGSIGLEFKRKAAEKYLVTIGSHFEVSNTLHQRYGEIRNVKLVLRVGRLGR